jgi:BioD-like phosphotransacetylase family protein
MKALYITSIETFSGKTAFCLALGRRLRAQRRLVGYLKPLSTQPRQAPGGVIDEDAEFVARALELEEPPAALAPVVVTREVLERQLAGSLERNLAAEVEQAFERVAAGKDVVLLEGGASLREGYAIGLSTVSMAERLGAQALVIVRWAGEMRAIDDALTARFRLGDALLGVVLNVVPEAGFQWASEVARPALERLGIPVYGVLPQEARLAAISVGELADALGARFLVLPDRRFALVETLTVGAMTVEAALPRFRRQPNKAVITGGDRTDIQLAALETSTRALILTGNMEPGAQVLERAEEAGVPVLLARQSTLEAVEAIERVFGKTRLGQPEKLARFEALMDAHFDYDRLWQALGLPV